jgi:hypothetical protein
MKIKIALVTFFGMLSPIAAFAQGCHGSSHADQQAAISCAVGTTFDTDAGTCVADVTG